MDDEGGKVRRWEGKGGRKNREKTENERWLTKQPIER